MTVIVQTDSRNAEFSTHDQQDPHAEFYFRSLEEDINDARANGSKELWVRALAPISQTNVMLDGEGQAVLISSVGVLKSALPDGVNKWDFINEVKKSLEESFVVRGTIGGGNWLKSYVTVHDVFRTKDEDNYIGFMTLVGTSIY